MGTIAAVIEDHVQALLLPRAGESRPASPIIAVTGGTVGYEPGNPILKRLNLRIDTDDRIALLGSNGNGKSTFAKFISGRLAPRIRRVEDRAEPQGRLLRAAPAG
ncbi:ATP-binding cassette domain-containing protein [Ensifer canadensis]